MSLVYGRIAQVTMTDHEKTDIESSKE